MPSYKLLLWNESEGDEVTIGIQVANADAAVHIAKKKYPSYAVKKMTADPDVIALEYDELITSLLVMCPYIHLVIPDAWNLQEDMEMLVRTVAASNIATENQRGAVAVLTDDIRELVSELAEKVLERI